MMFFHKKSFISNLSFMNWKKIWNKKHNYKNPKSLRTLLKLNGYDSKTSSINLTEWKKYTDYFTKNKNLKENLKVLDIGCGSGAFLLPFYKKNYTCYGLDYSRELIRFCKINMPKGKFFVSDALNLSKVNNQNFDYIFVVSVFQYFDNINYAKKVLNKIYSISHKNTEIILLDIPDKKKYFHWKKYIIRKFGLKIFNVNYTKLKHQFYTKKLFKDFAKSKNLKIKISKQNLINKPNSNFRFNVFLKHEKK